MCVNVSLGIWCFMTFIRMLQLCNSFLQNKYYLNFITTRKSSLTLYLRQRWLMNSLKYKDIFKKGNTLLWIMNFNNGSIRKCRKDGKIYILALYLYVQGKALWSIPDLVQPKRLQKNCDWDPSHHHYTLLYFILRNNIIQEWQGLE